MEYIIRDKEKFGWISNNLVDVDKDYRKAKIFSFADAMAMIGTDINDNYSVFAVNNEEGSLEKARNKWKDGVDFARNRLFVTPDIHSFQSGIDHSKDILDAVKYYKQDSLYETRKVIEAWGLGFNLGNVIKYVSRAGNKPGADKETDLKKAIDYLNFELQSIEK